jgi:uncharacterized protein YrrD
MLFRDPGLTHRDVPARHGQRRANMVEFEVNIGAHVRSSDGKRLGSIERLIYHPDTNQVHGFLLAKGHFSTNKIVAAGQVASTDHDGIVLKLDAHQAEQLPNFVQEQMLRAPGNLTYGGRWGAIVDVQGTGNQWMIRGQSGGQFAHTGAESAFLVAPIGTVEAQNLDNLPEDSILLSEGTDVVGSDGKKVGRVDEVFVDGKRGITGFLVKAGHLFRHDIRVPMSSVAGISHAHVRLNVTAEEAAHLKIDD